MKNDEDNKNIEIFFGLAKKLIDMGKAIEIDPYNNIYDLYDKTMARDCDLEFYVNIAKAAGGKVIDIGCGSGRLMRHMLKENIDVTGIDKSPRMIMQVDKKLRDEGYYPKLYTMDMRNITLADKYSSAIISFGALSYLNSLEECQNVLKSICNNLEPGGILAFDFDAGYGMEETYGPFLSVEKYIDETEEAIVRTVQTKGIDEQIRLCNQISYIIGKEESVVTVESTFEFKYSVGQMKKMLKEAGFKIQHIYSDFNLTQCDETENVEECIMVAKKEHII